MSGTPSFDFSNTTELKDLSFRCAGTDVQQITMALQTVQSENLQQITIRSCLTFPNPVGETIRQEWQDLDHLLVRFWALHSIRPKITYEVMGKGGDDLRAFAPTLLPELMGRGLVDLVENQR
jgi:hypothetical protein